MRKMTVCILIIILAVFAVPAVISGISLSDKANPKTEINTYGFDKEKGITAASFEKPFKIKVYIIESQKVQEYDFEEYIVGVLAGEMPPTYNSEALCAQAVAARSYILSKAETYFKGETSDEHYGAMICNNPNHCKSFKDIKKVKENWDYRHADDYEFKIKSAVKRTEGEYMTYNGEVVKAFFYAVSSGRTENSEDVWGTALPYLRSVDSREDINSDGFESMSTFTAKSLFNRLRQAKKDFSYSSDDNLNNRVFEAPTLSKGGGVISIKIGNTEFSGKEIREILGLKSTCFDIEVNGTSQRDNGVSADKLKDEDKITFRVYGYGHGVGMSQNGANVLASRGMKYKEILKHYYTDVDIVKLYKKL